MLHLADNAMAKADERTGEMAAALRADLAEGHDPAAVWWNLAHSFAALPVEDVAAGFASTLLKLARQTPKPKDVAVSAPNPADYPIAIPGGTPLAEAVAFLVRQEDESLAFRYCGTATYATTPELRYRTGSDWRREAEELAAAFGKRLARNGNTFELLDATWYGETPKTEVDEPKVEAPPKLDPAHHFSSYADPARIAAEGGWAIIPEAEYSGVRPKDVVVQHERTGRELTVSSRDGVHVVLRIEKDRDEKSAQFIRLTPGQCRQLAESLMPKDAA